LPTACPSDDPSLCVASCFDDQCAPWLDADGNRIEAHGAGLLFAPGDSDDQEGRYYWCVPAHDS